MILSFVCFLVYGTAYQLMLISIYMILWIKLGRELAELYIKHPEDAIILIESLIKKDPSPV